ncbi:MAG: hypothetical protein K2I07_05345 [Lachnospiraceae bacterium]|nr:hypothetical protein [Lachnospiraceae bacterium]
MSDFIVSFCVPVYENAEVAYRIASDLLENPDERFQVVMSDGQSKDDTVLRLLEIKDRRLKVCVNQEGAAATLNWYNALENGDGRYLYLVMGRDKLRANGITYLIEQLLWAQRQGIALMKDRADHRGELSRYDAYYFFCMQDHPTGIIFERKSFRNIIKRKSYFETDEIFPEIGIACELIRRARGAICDCRVFSSETYIDRSLVKSKLQIGRKDQFFFPKRRVKQILDMIDLITADHKLTAKEREKLVLSRCYLAFMQVSEQWKEWMHNETDVLHYGLEKREVSVNEQIRNIREAEREICACIKKYEWYGIVMRLKIKREAVHAIRHIYGDK